MIVNLAPPQTRAEPCYFRMERDSNYSCMISLFVRKGMPCITGCFVWEVCLPFFIWFIDHTYGYRTKLLVLYFCCRCWSGGLDDLSILKGCGLVSTLIQGRNPCRTEDHQECGEVQGSGSAGDQCAGADQREGSGKQAVSACQELCGGKRPQTSLVIVDGYMWWCK